MTTSPPPTNPFTKVILQEVPRVAYMKQDVHLTENLTRIWREALHTLSDLIVESRDRGDASTYIPTVPPLPEGISLVVKADPFGAPSDTSTPVGTVRTINGVLQELRPTASGVNRWMRVEQDDKEKEKNDNKGKPKVGGTPIEPEKEVNEKQKKKLDADVASAPFTKKEATITLKDGADESEPHKVSGEALGGLIVHKDPHTDDDTWVVTHAESGKRVVGGIPSENNAKVSALQLSRLLSWDSSEDELFKNPNFQDVSKFALQLQHNPYAQAPSSLISGEGSVAEEIKPPSTSGGKNPKEEDVLKRSLFRVSRYIDTESLPKCDRSNMLGRLVQFSYAGVVRALKDKEFDLADQIISGKKAATISQVQFKRLIESTVKQVQDAMEGAKEVSVAQTSTFDKVRYASHVVFALMLERYVVHPSPCNKPI